MKLTYDGSNGSEIAQTLTQSIFGTPGEDDQSGIVVNTEYQGAALVMDWRYYDGQTLPAAYHVPVGFTIAVSAPDNVGEVTNSEGTVMDINDLRLIA